MTLDKILVKYKSFEVIEGGAIRIEISTKSNLDTFTLVDREFAYLFTDGYKWCPHNNKGITYVDRRFAGKYEQLHRVITNAPRDKQVDHINGNTLDNRRCNLRICTASDNMKNRVIGKNNKSGYKGVLWRAERKRFVATIFAGNKQVHLGTFKSREAAAEAYDQAAIKYFGEFARTNASINTPTQAPSNG